MVPGRISHDSPSALRQPRTVYSSLEPLPHAPKSRLKRVPRAVQNRIEPFVYPSSKSHANAFASPHTACSRSAARTVHISPLSACSAVQV